MDEIDTSREAVEDLAGTLDEHWPRAADLIRALTDEHKAELADRDRRLAEAREAFVRIAGKKKYADDPWIIARTALEAIDKTRSDDMPKDTKQVKAYKAAIRRRGGKVPDVKHDATPSKIAALDDRLRNVRGKRKGKV